MNNILIITGPTASGKSKISMKIAQDNNGIIVNCDSKQIYREIPIITDQPNLNDTSVEHKLYGYVSVTQQYSVGLWIEDLKDEISSIIQQKKFPVITGGSGMYINSLIYGLSQIPKIEDSVRNETRRLFKTLGKKEFYALLIDKDPIAKCLHKNNSHQLLRAYEVIEQTGISIFVWKENAPREPIFKNFKLCILMPPRSEIYKKINERFINMINTSVIEEIENLLSLNIPAHFPAMKAHGVPEIIQYLQNKISIDQAIEIAQKNTRNYAKRQYTWFKHQFRNALFYESQDQLLESIKNSYVYYN
ncbi:tRNA dimethylallyltransferase [Ehrlichia chaffeensis str. Heartland]|uniref:tRNA dimethylallyltransferase n=1 Tax=Ehrlichia chaffeensis (strain ATCC CRL-10679 / Arkansas) TaxID=205920 RepID=MIAA_EHRCR|nr:tRNA (adenosine(37)-N6)-dimethylallyltransferase MiaA [Ehrlichia chaffeensis]Q2GGN4.1 RecName: Full=tRNA dimethylallyltransferase; AltName: Full=Dimethylallyl diphosphate:tRNA dimethylallyltransferase; Short=DMAPP:tRNA dimethylallyltransferase; Short=DMATase; AltName: Full=Isopentenyl-diphosphate:tRNA isopentenyltransferase; Short=IPP transferase; Short=IPPT; Short=IPTase [Ehrlichia chaffeensis str. Arkansas]ABD45295.1 tRNA delta(2)-isopentenylpyrophosphate transferase [Ehrlichia chaffeensis s